MTIYPCHNTNIKNTSQVNLHTSRLHGHPSWATYHLKSSNSDFYCLFATIDNLICKKPEEIFFFQ